MVGQHETGPAWLSCRGLFFARSIAISRATSLRPLTRLKPKPRVGKPAHDAALHFLARPKQYPLTDAERADLVQAVRATQARTIMTLPGEGLNGMREHYRHRGQVPRF